MFELKTVPSPENFQTLLKGVHVPHCALSFQVNGKVALLLENLIEFADLSKIEPANFHGTVINKPLKQSFLIPNFHLFRKFPGLKAQVSAEREGYTVTGYLANLLFKITELATEAEAHGTTTSQVLKRLECRYELGNHFFLEIAAMRALRFLLSKVTEIYMGDSAQAGLIKIHAVTTLLKAEGAGEADPYWNMLSNTNQAMAAVLGGCNTLLIKPHNLGIEQVSPFSHRIARNISNILKEESFLDKVADPGAGSYLLENLTVALAKKTWEKFQGMC